MRSFLKNREQYVSINDLETERLMIKTGVTQSSVLGPILFLKYINDPFVVSDEAKIPMFSYDTTIFQSGKGTQCLLSSERKPIYDGLSSSKLTINPVKYEATCFVRGKPEKFKVGYAELNHRTSCKHLGVHLEKKLIFLEYIDYY